MNEINKEIISRTINIPLYAFGYDQLEKVVSIEEIKKTIEKINVDNALDFNDYDIVYRAFLESCHIADKIEYQALTGFSWPEAMEQLGILAMLVHGKNHVASQIGHKDTYL
jgi:hypothetical protein